MAADNGGYFSLNSRGERSKWACSPCDCCISCWKKYTTDIPPDEILSLTAIQKWRRYRRPPWKLILSLFIVVCTTTQIILFSIYIAPYVRNAKVAFQELLAPQDSSIVKSTIGQKSFYHLYTKQDLRSVLTHLSNTYFDQRNITLDYYQYSEKSPDTPDGIRLAVQSFNAGDRLFDLDYPLDDSLSLNHYTLLTKADIHKVWTHNISHSVHSIKQIDASFDFINYNLASISQPCYRWEVMSRFSSRSSGKIDMEVLASPSLCHMDMYLTVSHEEGFSRWSNVHARDACVALLILTLFFCVLSQLLYIKAVVTIIKMVCTRDPTNPVSIISRSSTRRGDQAIDHISGSANLVRVTNNPSDTKTSTRAENERNSLTSPLMVFDGRVPCSEAIKYINGWVIIATVGNILNICSTCYCLSHGVLAALDDNWLAIMGFGALASWLSITQFFESTSTYYVLIATLQSGVPRVGRFFVGILPFFFAYAVFGVGYFSSYSERFSTLDNACVTLFSLLNGDVIHDVFQDLHSNSPAISRFYLYTFLALFIYAVLNIFVAIIEDSFFATKHVQEEGKSVIEEGKRSIWLQLLDEENSRLPSVISNPSKAEKLEKVPSSEGASYYITPSAPDIIDLKHGDDDVTQDAKIQTPQLSRSHSIKYPKKDVEGGKKGDVLDVKEGYFQGMKSEKNKMSAFQSILRIVDKALKTDLKNEFSQVALELKFPPEMLRPPHKDGFYPCGFPDCLYCSVRSELLKNLDTLKADVKDKVKELVHRMKLQEEMSRAT